MDEELATGVKWLPYDLMDECIPALRTSPDDWIVAMDDGAPALSNGQDGDEKHMTLLRDNEEVQFCSCTSYGNATLTLKRGGTWSVDRQMPRGAEQVCALNGWQLESLALSIEECVGQLIAADAEPGEYELSYYTWSDGIPFIFDGIMRSFRMQESVLGAVSFLLQQSCKSV